ncbi:uncharacterized protein LOC111899444 [Lactuca sativa]|uniref:uncharacterized protein LOC111899444 n=1 Tax=Lactuca sativa TaxID=4236 RepID=UPI0022B01D3B|nr:uncharacterized protein LOC111899444 [Lactuca sativa]
MAKRQAVEAVDQTMQDIINGKLPFGGKIMVMGGDFRQVLSVVRRGTRAQIVDSSLRMSPLWASVKRLQLNINMRAEETLDENCIYIPDNMSIPYTDKTNSLDVLIDVIFPYLQSNSADSKFIISRAILSTKNESIDETNNKLIERFSGEKKFYYSFDVPEDDKNNLYPMEYLNSLNVSGIPPHYLRLKIGCPVILLRNIDPSNGLCNGIGLICRAFQQNVIDA